MISGSTLTTSSARCIVAFYSQRTMPTAGTTQGRIMSLRTMVLAFGVLSFAVAAGAQLSWLPLDEALKTAQASGRLILLDLHNGADDKKGDKWIDEAFKNPGVARAMEQMVLAVLTTVPKGEAF